MNEELFVSTEIFPREVTINGKKVTLYFKEIPAVEFRKYSLIESEGTLEDRSVNMARLISLSLVEPNGALSMDLEKAKTLKSAALVAIFTEVLKINKQEKESDQGKQQ